VDAGDEDEKSLSGREGSVKRVGDSRMVRKLVVNANKNSREASEELGRASERASEREREREREKEYVVPKNIRWPRIEPGSLRWQRDTRHQRGDEQDMERIFEHNSDLPPNQRTRHKSAERAL